MVLCRRLGIKFAFWIHVSHQNGRVYFADKKYTQTHILKKKKLRIEGLGVAERRERLLFFTFSSNKPDVRYTKVLREKDSHKKRGERKTFAHVRTHTHAHSHTCKNYLLVGKIVCLSFFGLILCRLNLYILHNNLKWGKMLNFPV